VAAGGGGDSGFGSRISGRSGHSLGATPLARREKRTVGTDATDGGGDGGTPSLPVPEYVFFYSKTNPKKARKTCVFEKTERKTKPPARLR